MQTIEHTVLELVKTLWFVITDLNTELDYETMLIIIGTINKHIDIDYDFLLQRAINRQDIKWDNVIKVAA